MLSTQTTRAIARVEADGGLDAPRRGTGFLVTRELVLTALHVVQGATRIELVFEAGRAAAHTTPATVARTGPGGAEGDWAILSCASPPPETTPLPLDQVIPVAGPVTWDTFGYAIYGKPGGNFTGVVRGAGPPLDLRCDELDGQPEDRAQGISGAPCVVDGVVIGLIIAGRQVQGAVAGASLQAIASEAIVGACGGAVPRDSVGPYPYDAWFEGAVAGLGAGALAELTRALGLSGERRGPALVRRLARALHDAGGDGVVQAIQAVSSPDRPKLARIAVLARSLWVKEPAAVLLGECLKDAPARTAAVNALLPETGVDYHARAWWCLRRTEPPYRPLQLKNRTGEDQAKELEQELRTVLADAFHPADDQDLRESLTLFGPVTVLVPDPAPSTAVIGKLAAEFPGVHFLLLTHPVGEAGLLALSPAVTYLAPGHPPADEDAARRMRSKIQKLVESITRQP
jgi:hypothetical protein